MTSHALFERDLYWLRTVRAQMQCISHLIGDTNFSVESHHSFRDSFEWIDRKIATLEGYQRARRVREREHEAAARLNVMNLVDGLHVPTRGGNRPVEPPETPHPPSVIHPIFRG